MRRLMAIVCITVLAMVAGTASAATWNFTNAADYWTNNAVVTALPGGGSAYVAPRVVDPVNPDPDDVAWGADYAAVFARINTQAYHLSVGDITGGGFTVTGMNQPNAVYGSLYLSPTGGGGSTVMINMSPMGRTGANGAFVYTFDLNTAADVKVGAPNWGAAQYTGTFGGAIDWVNASSYSGTYAAFFGPQIGLSGTSGTTFTVTQIQLATVPLPAAAWAGLGLMGVLGMAKIVRRRPAQA